MCLAHQNLNVFNSDQADAFARRLLDTLNAGAVCQMTSIGHRTGLFDVMATLPAATSETIAEEAGLNERYVREWLNAMTVSRIVEHDPENRTYRLPPEHAAFLTRSASPDNIAVFAQYIPLLGTVEDDIVACFKTGGGVPYDRFPRFHSVMAEDSAQTVLSSLNEHILPLASGLTEKLTRGIDVLDVGCGRGRALIQLARDFPASRFTGLDLSREAIEFANAQAQRCGLDNVRFLVRDVTDFEHTADPERYDLITTFDAIHDQARPLSVLRGIYRALKADGIYLMQDIHGHSEVHKNLDHPVAPLLYAVSTMHCMTVSLAQGGEGLGTMWGQEKAQELIRAAGFENVEIHQLEHDFQNDYYIIRK
jgi:2-polyprenyl-3-methyl-5-hydroxy-6-metoxy-1,4-benzoquinol methylase